MTHGTAHAGGQPAAPSARMTARSTNAMRGPAGRPRPRPRPLAAPGPGGHRPPPRPVTPNKGGDWRGRQSPPGGAAPPRAPEPKLTPRERNYPRRDAPGLSCERRRLRPAFVSALSNAGAEPACPGQRVCPARLVPALPGGTVVPSP